MQMLKQRPDLKSLEVVFTEWVRHNLLMFFITMLEKQKGYISEKFTRNTAVMKPNHDISGYEIELAKHCIPSGPLNTKKCMFPN